MDIYSLSRNFWDYSFENPENIKPNHIAMYFFAIEHCNRLGWKQKFGFPTTMVMDAISIKSYNTFIKTLNDLVEFGFIKMIEKSKNQYSSNIIALSLNNNANNKALDKAMIKHSTKQSESTVQSIDSIDIPLYNNTNLPINFLLEKETKEISPKDLIEDDLVNPEIEQRKKVAQKKEIEYPFPTKEFKAGWDLWKAYRKKKDKFQYFDEVSEKKALSELFNISKMNESTALAIIRQSIDKGWKGFFELKNKTNGNNEPNSNRTPNLAFARRR